MSPLFCRLLSVLVSAAALAACQPNKAPTMTPEEAKHIDQLTARMTTRCIGRYLIDLPEAFVLNSQSRTLIEEVTLQVEPTRKFEFDLLLQARTAHLKAETMFGKDTPSLTAIHELADKSGFVFNRSESRAVASARTLELLAWRDGHQISMSIEATDMELARRRFEGDTRQTDTHQKLAHLLRVYERTRGRQDHEIPTEQGVCFANGFVKGAPTDQEWVDMHHQWKDVQDVYFSYHYMSHIGPQSPSLLGRGREIEANLATVNGKTVRKGERSGHGLQFEEWLLYRDSDPGVRLYDYVGELNSAFGNAQKPFLRLALYSGVRPPRAPLTLEQAAVDKPVANTSLGEAPLTVLWDKVASTLRLRPGAF
jgi:hypothetical protein